MEMPWQPGLKTCSGTDSVEANRQSAGAEDASLKVTVFTGKEGCARRKELRLSSPLGRSEMQERLPPETLPSETRCGSGFTQRRQEGKCELLKCICSSTGAHLSQLPPACWY